VLPYDNTNGSKTGIALANQSATAATITVAVLDQGGSQACVITGGFAHLEPHIVLYDRSVSAGRKSNRHHRVSESIR
jgi:hypothetical protein